MARFDSWLCNYFTYRWKCNVAQFILSTFLSYNIALSTLICSQSVRFRCFGKRMIDSGLHYRFDAFSTVHARTFENNSITRRDVSWTLCARYNHTPQRYVRSSFSFWCASSTVFRDRFRPSTLIRYVCVFSLIHFQECFKIDAFSMKTFSVLVWTEGLNASKCMRFQTKKHECERGLN